MCRTRLAHEFDVCRDRRARRVLNGEPKLPGIALRKERYRTKKDDPSHCEKSIASTFSTSPATVPVTLALRFFSLVSFLSAVSVRALPASSNFKNLPSAVTSP